MIIYKTTNLVNGKIYIGQTIKNTNNNEYLGSGKYLKRAIIKYGKKNFKRETLITCKSQEELNAYEIYFIEKFNALDKSIGYNLHKGGYYIKPEQRHGAKGYNRPKGKNSPRYGKSYFACWADNYGIEKANELMTELSKKLKDVRKGENNPNYGNGWKIAGEKNCQFGMTGEKSPNWGRKHSKETKKKIRESALKYHNGTRTDKEREAIKKGMAKNRNYYIEQYDKETGELLNTYLSILEAKLAVDTTYYRVATNNHPKFNFIKVLKDE